MRIFLIILIIVIIVVVVFVALVVGAGMYFSRNTRVANPTQAKANGRDMIKNAKVVVVVGAHPDDLEYYTGGTIGVLAAAGKKVIGVTSADLSDEQAVRRVEGRQAAKILGYTPVFLGHPERDYENGLTDRDKTEMRQELISVIRKYRADTMVCYDYADQAPLYHHIDHIATGREAQAAAKAAGVKNVYLYSSGHPDTQVDVAAAADKKSAAIASHVSQQNRRWIRILRTVFSRIPLGRPRDGVPGLSNIESFRKL